MLSRRGRAWSGWGPAWAATSSSDRPDWTAFSKSSACLFSPAKRTALSMMTVHDHSDAAASPIITAFTTLAGGLFLMMSRTKAITQVIGYLMLENGIYLVGATLTGKAHSLYIVEFGVLLDLLVGVMIMGIILNNINRTFDDVDTAHLEQLKD